MTSPVGPDHPTNSLLGYCYLFGHEPFMKENIPHVAQVGVFCGAVDAMRLSENREDWRALRAVYSLLAAQAAPLVGIVEAMLLVNWLSWALCAWVAWRLTKELSQAGLAALLAVVLVSGGMGMIAHVGDYSPHLLAFATYYFGIWLIFRSRVYCDPVAWQIHLGLGLFFAISCLVYNTGVMLVGVYLVVSLRHNHLRHLLLVSVVSLSARPLWQSVLGARIQDIEAQYLRRALEHWIELFRMGPAQLAGSVLQWISEHLLFFDSPLVVVSGLICCLLCCLRTQPAFPLRLLIWTTIGIPVLASMVFAPAASARGYIVYGGSIWVFVCLALQISRLLSASGGWQRKAAILATAVLIVSHFVWSTAHFAGYLGPIKTYFLGWQQGSYYLVHPPLEAFSLTGLEPTPRLFGGSGSLGAAGAYFGNDVHMLEASQRSLAVALLSRAWFFAYFAAWVAVIAAGGRKRTLLLTALLTFYLVGSALGSTWLRTLPAFFSVDSAVALDAGQSLRYELIPGGPIVALARQSHQYGDALTLFMSGQAFSSSELCDVVVAFYVGDRPIAASYEGKGAFVVSAAAAQQLLHGLEQRDPLVCEITNVAEHPTRLAGWQRNALPNRHCVYDTARGAEAARPAVLPLVELRLVRTDGTIRAAGF